MVCEALDEAVEQLRRECPEMSDEQIRECAAWLVELAEVERTD